MDQKLMIRLHERSPQERLLIAETLIHGVQKELPCPFPMQRRLYSEMTGEEFERWLYDHGICNPKVTERIDCDVVPRLIDEAIGEEIARRNGRYWTPGKPTNEAWHVLVTRDWGDGDLEVCEMDYMVCKTSPEFNDNVTAWMPLPEPYKEEE